MLRTIPLFLLFLVVPAFAHEKANEREGLAKALEGQMAAGDFTKAVEPFDDVMKKGLPADKLKQVWDSVIRQYGAFQRASETRTEKTGRYQAVFVTAEFEKGKLDAKVVFTDDQQITGLFFVPSGAYRPPAYSDPAAFKEQEITVGKGFWSLPGTLSLPQGEGPFPAVVLVHGSGPNDRDKTIGPNKPFRDLAHGLASREIAVLRYEKRTRHHQLAMALLAGSITVKEETVDDAAAAVESLKAHEKLDGKRIFVLGHSLGGNMIPRIGGANSHIAGFISLAGSVTPLEDLVLTQTKYILSLDGETTDEERAKIAEIERQVALVKSPELSAKTVTKELPLGVPATYWLDLRGYDAAQSAKELRRPLLILQGERDYQVTMDEFAQWKKALESRDDVKFISYPKLNHLFVAGEGKSSPAEYTAPGNVAEAVIVDIAEWIKGVRAE